MMDVEIRNLSLKTLTLAWFVFLSPVAYAQGETTESYERQYPLDEVEKRIDNAEEIDRQREEASRKIRESLITIEQSLKTISEVKIWLLNLLEDDNLNCLMLERAIVLSKEREQEWAEFSGSGELRTIVQARENLENRYDNRCSN